MFTTLLPIASKATGVILALVNVLVGNSDVTEFSGALETLLIAAGPILLGEIVPRAGRFATWSAAAVRRTLGNGPDLLEAMLKEHAPDVVEDVLADALTKLQGKS